MPIKGYADYKRREFCNDIKCPIQISMNEKGEEPDELREVCKKRCLYSTYEFHHWLIEKGYLLVREK